MLLLLFTFQSSSISLIVFCLKNTFCLKYIMFSCYSVLKHIIEAYILGTSSLHSLIYSIKKKFANNLKKVREQSQKSSRTISFLFANSFSFILDQTVNAPFSLLVQVQDSLHFPCLYEKVLNWNFPPSPSHTSFRAKRPLVPHPA